MSEPPLLNLRDLAHPDGEGSIHQNHHAPLRNLVIDARTAEEVEETVNNAHVFKFIDRQFLVKPSEWRVRRHDE